VKAFDPAGTLEAEKLLTNVEFVSGPYFCAENADVLAIITEWNEFRALDLERIKSVMRTPNIVDLRNIYSPDEMAAAGFKYTSVGRPKD
jgi:UDPglucose 6-dehydrogenase